MRRDVNVPDAVAVARSSIFSDPPAEALDPDARAERNAPGRRDCSTFAWYGATGRATDTRPISAAPSAAAIVRDALRSMGAEREQG